MQRRNFMKLAGLGAAALALPALGFYTLTPAPQQALVGIILHEFSFLRLDRTGVEQFVAEYYTLTGGKQPLLVELKTKAYYLLGIRAEQSQLIRELTTLYLLSTDFFQQRMDEGRVVKYVGWYNPHKTPCLNPFSAIYYPPAVA